MEAVVVIAAAFALVYLLKGMGTGAGAVSYVNGIPQPPPNVNVDPSPPGLAMVTGGLDNITQAILQHEGANPTWNNPGALKYATAQQVAPGLAVGQTPGGFAQFADQGDGWDALNGYVAQTATNNPNWDFYDFFQHYLGQPLGGPTVTDQGNSDAYAEYVANYLGVDPTTPVSSYIGG